MVPLYKPYMPNLPLLDEILHSGQIAAGIWTEKFETDLKKFFNVENLIVTSSFNTAISIAITVMGLEYGDEVIASPMACLASTQPYHCEGLRIKWADIDPNTGTLDPDDVKNRITNKTKLIIHNHFCGYVGYIDEINRIAKEYDIFVIDDGIECFGSEYNGKMVGNVGSDITVYSFNPVRLLTTIDGGCLIFNDKELYKKSILVRDCGIDRTKFRDNMGEINPNCDITIKGYSATMSNVNAYIGIEQLKSINLRLTKQRENANKWNNIIKNIEEYYGYNLKNILLRDTNPNYWVYGLLSENKNELINVFRNKGYYSSSVHINNNIYSVFNKQDTLKGVQKFINSFIAIPCGWWLDKIELRN